MPFYRMILCLCMLFYSSSTLAYQLDEHAWITEQAITEFHFCFSGYFSDDDRSTLQKFNRREDTNLIRKWLKYSHFYNPEKNLKMRREPSSVRVLESELEITKLIEEDASRSDLFEQLGAVVHHLQDATSPPHAVPVMHGLKDGFEAYQLKEDDLPPPRIAKFHCEDLTGREKDNLTDLLFDTATGTLGISRGTLSGEIDEQPEDIPLNFFWLESGNNEFGQYGAFGNAFGIESIQLEDKKSRRARSGFFAFTRDTFVDFKVDQLLRAVNVTKQALFWLKEKLRND